jgi:outer membrane protein TolC
VQNHKNQDSLATRTGRRLLLPWMLLVSQGLFASDLDSVIEMALKDSPTIKSSNLDLTSKAADLKAQDKDLVPALNSDLNYSQDKSVTLSKPSNDGTRSANFSSSVDVPFSTGTKISVGIEHKHVLGKDENTEKDQAQWFAKLTQPFLKNRLGIESNLRKQSEKIDYLLADIQNTKTKSNLVLQVEQNYWDYLSALKQKEIYQKNLERRTQLEKWTSQRIKQFAAEPQDLLQVQSLLAQLQLNVLSVDDQIQSSVAKLQTIVPSLNLASFIGKTNDLATLRNPKDLVQTIRTKDVPTTPLPVKIDALETSLQLLKQNIAIEQAIESLRPNLDGYVQYASSATEKSISPSWGDAARAKNASATIGVSLKMPLYGDMKNDIVEASQIKKQSLTLKAEASQLESTQSWSELNRRIQLLSKQANAAQQLAILQAKKVAAEKQRHQQGRTTSLQMTTFEVDAAESELKYFQILTELRKTEANARLYVLNQTN